MRVGFLFPLVGLAALALAGGGTATAQIASNLDIAEDDSSLSVASGAEVAQGFTTGANATGYTLTHVELDIEVEAGTTGVGVEVWSATGGAPQRKLYSVEESCRKSDAKSIPVALTDATLDGEHEVLRVRDLPRG